MKRFILVLDILIAIIAVTSARSPTSVTVDEGGNINCRNCKGCTGCIDCVNCNNCTGCIGCNDCNSCGGCIRCHNCNGKHGVIDMNCHCSDNRCKAIHIPEQEYVLKYLNEENNDVSSKFVTPLAPAKTSQEELASRLTTFMPFEIKLLNNMES